MPRVGVRGGKRHYTTLRSPSQPQPSPSHPFRYSLLEANCAATVRKTDPDWELASLVKVCPPRDSEAITVRTHDASESTSPADRRVFMWIWGDQTQVLTDAALAAAHNTSITDVPLGCGPKGGFQMSRPFNASWMATCAKASKTLREAGLRPWISLEPVVDSNMTANRAFWLNPPLEQLKEGLATVGAVGWNFDWECNGTPQDEDAYLSFLTRARAALGATVVDANGNGCTKGKWKSALFGTHGKYARAHVPRRAPRGTN
jgi:hypothetical protein